ncbi:ubiquitin carboxyl-terminal hydrolase 8-like [Mya arenaria]|uniref:ubiquitin carboxyl-terminal hydrolase 8-like n=1 Tax=Mya arenaria TaxID=6604 RepID=UPI0022E38685|nr:ubiquitin carboxyl-terminal hydrolase 8-like [Mya arenaria]
MPVSAKKDGAKKGLYIAKSMSELNKMAELPAKLKTNNAKILVKTADKMLKEAEHSELMQDEERAYVLFMKYFNVVTYLKKTSDYRKEKTYYDNLLGSKNLLSAIDNAEQLSGSLKERFDLIEAESVAEKLSSLDKSQDDSGKTKIPGGKGNDVKIDEPQETAKTKPEPTPPAPQSEPGKVTCAQLYTMLQDRDTQMILMDVRPMEDFQDSRINHKAIINVPAGAIKPGTTVTVIEKALPMDSMSLWKQRGNIDHIILLDRNSRTDNVKIGSTLQTLKDAIFKYDSTVIIKSEPLILDGGYEDWMLAYPTTCLNPSFEKLTKPVVQSTQGSLLDFDYPDFDEEFLKPKQPEQKPQDTVSLSERFSGFQNGEVGMKSTSLPTIDRATKPVVDRSTKANLTKIMVTNDGSKSDSTTSLYPDVRAVSGPGSTVNQNRGFTNTDTRSSSANFSNTDSRSAVRKMTGQSDRISESQSSTSLNKVADELSNELTELDRQKKQREEELAELKRESEKVREESRARLERMRQEEQRLSELEEMRKKQQTDVADLFRMKRELQQRMEEERSQAATEVQYKQREQMARQDDLAHIAEEEKEKKRRQFEVERLRAERKKREEDTETVKWEEETRRIVERERMEREKREIEEAQKRAKEEEEKKLREIAAAEDRARQLRIEEEKKTMDTKEKHTIEERLRRERELQAQLEKERQAALEERRRLQAEHDRLEAERKEKKRQEKEKQDRERLAQEEADRKLADEARRAADEKLRLMNEAKATPKSVPSPNLKVGWEKKLDYRTNRYFYINHTDGTTQWDPPNTPGPQKGTYTTKLKDDNTTPKRGLSRSNSSPNIAKMFEDEGKSLPEKKIVPSVNRGIKPVEKRILPAPMPAKRRDLNPVYGSMGRALTGLRNLGNTCYMNSTIQCLNNTSPLVTYLLTDTYLYDINRHMNEGELVDDFAYIVKALWSEQYRCITPRDFKRVAGHHQPMFAGYEQQDSQEFLTFLMDGLHEGLNKVKSRPKIPEQNNDNLPDMKAAELAWRDHKLHNESIIVELFQGQLKSSLMCLGCKNQSVTFQAFMYLSLPLPSSTRCTLADCLRQFSAEEKLTDRPCPKCKSSRSSMKKIEIWKLPHILLIAFNRFVYDGPWRTKISTHVDFPTKDVSLSPFVRGPHPKSYKLYAVSNHFGTLDGGHYTACCRNPCTNKWYKFDDHEVYDISESSVKTSAAYVLYYTSIEMKPPEYKRRFE